MKLKSPLEKNMVIEPANGGDGYIPPPEQHLLGGYNTWAARSAGLEVDAEPRIVEAALEQLETVAGRPRPLSTELRRGRGEPPAGEAGGLLAAGCFPVATIAVFDRPLSREELVKLYPGD